MANRMRNKQIKFFVATEEEEVIEKKAAIAQLNKSQYLRKVAIDGYIIKQDLSSLRELSIEINKIGVNINQIAKHANEIGGVTKSDIEDVKGKMEQIWQLLKSILSNQL